MRVTAQRVRSIGEREVQRYGLEPVVKPVYRQLISKPYWAFKRLGNPRIRRSVGDVEVVFTAQHRKDTLYQEIESERPVLLDIESELRPDDVFYDFGANIGLYSCFVSRCLDNGQVVAFEPSPIAYDRLQENATLNGDGFEHRQLALSAVDGESEIAVDVVDTHSRQSTMRADPTSDRYDSHTVEERRLDTLLEEVGYAPPTVAKIDVEGAEYDVLKGMGSHLDSIRVLYCEIHDDALERFGVQRKDVVSVLRSAGFSIEPVHREVTKDYVKATRTE